ncbi:MAG: phage portal protein [Ruminococcus sp.]|nr:phage portal protein [Ruminococcus sp.]
MFWNRNKNISSASSLPVQTVSRSFNDNGSLAFSRFQMQSKAERDLYSSLRDSVPVIDAALSKIVRLIGNFSVKVNSSEAQKIIDDFIENVPTVGGSFGLLGFIYNYLDDLLTYGEAVGEMVVSNGSKSIAALYNASLDDVEIRAGQSPLDLIVCKKSDCTSSTVLNQRLITATLLNPKSGTVCGTSVLKGLPFVSSILLRIFSSLKTNWERVGDVRFAVTYKPEQGSGAFSKESAKLIADEWRKAMRSDSVCDFISVGDVSVKVIGAESDMPDCDIPVKHIMEQILAKLGIPPFMLGISWSSTERMSEQQADILTSELEFYRSMLNPVIKKIVSTHLLLNGYNCRISIEWNDINLQDSVELAQARLNNAQAMKIEQEIGFISE